MAKHHKITVNTVRGQQAIDLTTQGGQPVRIWAVDGANYVLQGTDEQGRLMPLEVKAKRVGQDLYLMLDDAQAPQLMLIGYYDEALRGARMPLLGALSDGTLREYMVLDAPALGTNAAALHEGQPVSELVLNEPFANADGSAAALAPLAPLTLGPGAWVAMVAGVAAVGAAGGGGGGTPASTLSPAEALQQLQTAALLNTAKDLDTSVYKTAGVTGVTSTNVAAVNDVLNSAAVTDTTLSSVAVVQTIVDASNKVSQAADGIDGNLTTPLTLDDWRALALTGVTTASANLLSDVVDSKAYVAVDTVAELQALADAALAVISYGKPGALAPTVAQINSLIADLPSLGNLQVSSDALTAVQNSILANNTDSNGPIASQSEVADIVQTAMDNYSTSLARIRAFAAQQASGLAGQAIPPESIPALTDYNHVGVSGVSVDNLDALNDALASARVDGNAVLNPSTLQNVIDAYNSILSEANGALPDASPGQNPTAAQYAAIGADIGSASTDAQDLALLNDAVGAQTTAGVDTIAELNELARITNAIQSTAAGQTPGTTLNLADFALIGLNTGGLSDATALRQAIASKADDGSQTDSLAELQALIQGVVSGGSAVPAAAFAIGLQDVLGQEPLSNASSDAQTSMLFSTGWASGSLEALLDPSAVMPSH